MHKNNQLIEFIKDNNIIRERIKILKNEISIKKTLFYKIKFI